MDWEKFQTHLEQYSDEEKKLIKNAFSFAVGLHEGQKRLSGEPFISHPIAVALKITSLKLGASTVAASLLHDSIEDGPTTLKIIRDKFGEETVFLVDGVTKADAVRYRGTQREVESIRRMFLAVAKDIRVVLIKLMDRLHNMETLEAHQEEKQKKIALETLEIYAPIADRLGMGDIKGQLEDLAFQYVYPEEYQWIISEIKEKITEREKHLNRVIPVVKDELKKENIEAMSIHSRAKHYYSLWKKLLRHNMDWNLIADLAALRIIVPDIEKCYHALGVIHKLWKPLPGRIKDYIALPKPNNYQSLHTTVFCIDGKITEFQIRTPQMHEEAEHGIAAHWNWEAAGKPKKGTLLKNKNLEWVKQLGEWQEHFKARNYSSKDFLEALKIDFFKDRIFALTPKGDVIDLPSGATAVDFAYQIHSQIGNQAQAAKVNGKLVALSYVLSSGDVVEIIIQKNKKPAADWLAFVKTNLARNFIRDALKDKIKSAKPGDQNQGQKIELEVKAKNRVGLLRDISNVLSLFRIDIKKATSDVNPVRTGRSNGAKSAAFADISLLFYIKNKNQLERIKTKIKLVKGVEEIVVNSKS